MDYYNKYYVNDSLNHQSDINNRDDYSIDYDKNRNYTYKNLKSSQLAINTPCLSLYFSKYCVNNRNDYSIDKDYVNDSKNHQIDYDKNRNYKSLYYINDLSDHQNGNDFSNHNLQSNIFYKKY